MTDNPTSTAAPGKTAGALIREARETQGVHIAVLAAAIKVSPRKLDALEGDRYGELPDATFTRALAQTVCRALKLDPQPVLALLPSAATAGLDAVSEGLNTPFKERAGMGELSALLPRAPLVWAGLALLAAAALLLYWPFQPAPTPPQSQTQSNLPPVLPAASEPLRTEPPVAGVAPAPETTVVAPASTATTPAAGAPAAANAGPGSEAAARPMSLPPALTVATGAAISVSEPVWLEVIDATGAVVFQRTIQPGEALSFDQRPPLRLKVGNAAAAKLTFRGEAVDMLPHTRANVARLELK